jgi:hypothetical protein
VARGASAGEHPLHADLQLVSQVEIWFAKIQRDLIDLGIFTSTTDLRRKIMSYIRLHNRSYCPFRWTYRNTKQRIRVNEKTVTAH